MSYENLPIERDAATLVVTINRPRVLNALNAQTVAELGDAFESARTDDSVRVVILTGAGEKSFVAGADINELAAGAAGTGAEIARRGQIVFDRVEQLGKPVIAAINGFALGGGCELALACTIRLAADSARLGQPEINLGLIPGYAGSQRLPRLVGRGRALELLLTGDQISAEDAWRIGLVNRVVPGSQLMATARELAAVLASKPPIAVRALLDAVAHGADMPLDAAQRYEAALFGLLLSTDDVREGTRAFLEKRKPVFKGR
jgi:enoyl-CoA hydratase